jgi:hypothetical protein
MTFFLAPREPPNQATLAPSASGGSVVGELFRDVQRERGGVMAGERVRDMKGPRRAVAGRGLVFMVSAGCSFC